MNTFCQIFFCVKTNSSTQPTDFEIVSSSWQRLGDSLHGRLATVEGVPYTMPTSKEYCWKGRVTNCDLLCKSPCYVMFYPINSLVVTRKLRLILWIKIWLFLNLVKPISIVFYNSKNSKYVLIFSLALVVTEFLSILWFFAK